MNFKIGDPVRYIGQKTVMTITNIREVKGGKSILYCVYINDDMKEVSIQIHDCNAIEKVPSKVLKK